ncbi:SURF1 family protein [Gordonia alkaliphila]|uniref:SURF1-like protein n=1 Tax=Gordonia alkaliphila TaxID=1053547 RepID=A0ABP8ZDZ8_9ACTN
MQLLRTFLRPGWILSTVLVGIFVALCFLILAPWQLDKNTDTERRNNLIRSATETAAVPLEELVPVGGTLDDADQWREVTMTGHYLTDQQIVMRLRSVAQRPAAEVMTPFQIAGTDRVVLVDRGWVRPEVDGAVILPGAPPEQVTIHARLHDSEGTSVGKEPRMESLTPGGTGDKVLTAYTTDTAALSAASGLALDPFYVQLVPDQPGGLGAIELPQLESGPYLGYGLQWLAFGIMAPLGVAYFVWAEVKHRRALRRNDDGTQAPAGEPTESTRKTERRRIRDELRQASGPELTSAAARGPDHAATPAADEPAPDEDVRVSTADEDVRVKTADEDVKAKLARRYGR